MPALLRLARGIDAVNRAVGRCAAWLSLAMVLMGVFNALARHFDRAVGGGLSSNAYVEGQWYLFSLVFLLGAPHALRAGAHVRVDVLYGRLPERARHWIDLLGGLLFTIPFCVFVLWISWPSVHESWVIREGSSDPGGLPRWPIKAVVPVAFALLLAQAASETLKRGAVLAGRGADEVGLREPDDVRGADRGRA
jgi:TRAP-type mannitol/chloroaromatic compound transport system permease small subunit